MVDKDKRYTYTVVVLEFIYFLTWLLELVIAYLFKSDVKRDFGVAVTIWNSLDILSYHNHTALKLFGFALLLIIVGLIIPSIGIRNAYEDYQQMLCVVTLVINILLIIWLLIALANPVLIAIFFAIVIGAFFMAAGA